MAGQQKESILVTQYLKKFHRTKPQWKRVRLGQVADHKEAKFYKVIMRWADAIVLSDGKVLIIEGKLRPTPGAIGQLEVYKDLFKVTPEFSAYWAWPIEMILLAPVLDLNLVEICSKKGIIYDHFVPEGWED